MISPIKQIVTNTRLKQIVYCYESSSPLFSALGKTALKYKYALSFKDSLGNNNNLSHTIFAWTNSTEEVKLHVDWTEQDGFMPFMHRIFRNSPKELEYLLQSRAHRQREGWLSIADERAPIVYGRAPESSDVIAMVRCEDGKVLTDTYEAMPVYSLITSTGICSPPNVLFQKLIHASCD